MSGSAVNGLAMLDVNGAIGTLTINRPDARNALSIELLVALHEKVDELAGRMKSGEDVRVLVVTGAGKAFCAGMDLKQVLASPENPIRLLSLLGELCLKIRRLACVTIAKVNGAAIGGGCGLACVCDFAITHADSKMGFPEVDLGVCPAVVAPWLVRKVGAGKARMILLRGGLMSGLEAARVGIASEAVGSVEELGVAVEGLATKIAGGGAMALAATKGLLNELDGSLDEAMAQKAAELSARVINMPETRAVLKKRLG